MFPRLDGTMVRIATNVNAMANWRAGFHAVVCLARTDIDHRRRLPSPMQRTAAPETLIDSSVQAGTSADVFPKASCIPNFFCVKAVDPSLAA